MSIASWFKWIPGGIFVVAFAVFLITTNVRLAFNSTAWYEYGFRKYDVAGVTGLTSAQLSNAAHQIRDYFNSSAGILDVQLTVNDEVRPLFTEREILHMKDVKALVRNIFRVQEGTFLYLFLFATGGLFALDRDFGRRLRGRVVQGSTLTIAVVLVAGFLTLVSFEPMFLLFHYASFANDLWQLDPSTSYLLQMFPDGFWQDSAFLIGLSTWIEASLAVVLLGLGQLWGEWRRRVAAKRMPQYL